MEAVRAQRGKDTQQAQEEAKERAAKLRRQQTGVINKNRVQTLTVTNSVSTACKPYILLDLGIDLITDLALLDTGVDVNVLSYETWESFGKQELASSSKSIDLLKGNSMVQGCLNLNVFIGNTDVHERFYVLKPGHLETPIILGQPWQRRYNGVPKWRKDGVNFEVEGVQ